MSARLCRPAPAARRGRSHRGLALLLGVWLLGLTAVTAPHLVHHAFDADGDGECGFLDAALHAPAVSAAPLLALAPLPVAERLVVPPPPVHSRTAPAVPPGRGPPPLAPA